NEAAIDRGDARRRRPGPDPAASSSFANPSRFADFSGSVAIPNRRDLQRWLAQHIDRQRDLLEPQGGSLLEMQRRVVHESVTQLATHMCRHASDHALITCQTTIRENFAMQPATLTLAGCADSQDARFDGVLSTTFS